MGQEMTPHSSQPEKDYWKRETTLCKWPPAPEGPLPFSTRSSTSVLPPQCPCFLHRLSLERTIMNTAEWCSLLNPTTCPGYIPSLVSCPDLQGGPRPLRAKNIPPLTSCNTPHLLCKKWLPHNQLLVCAQHSPPRQPPWEVSSLHPSLTVQMERLKLKLSRFLSYSPSLTWPQLGLKGVIQFSVCCSSSPSSSGSFERPKIYSNGSLLFFLSRRSRFAMRWNLSTFAIPFP